MEGSLSWTVGYLLVMEALLCGHCLIGNIRLILFTIVQWWVADKVLQIEKSEFLAAWGGLKMHSAFSCLFWLYDLIQFQYNGLGGIVRFLGEGTETSFYNNLVEKVQSFSSIKSCWICVSEYNIFVMSWKYLYIIHSLPKKLYLCFVFLFTEKRRLRAFNLKDSVATCKLPLIFFLASTTLNWL